ncbi:MAG: DNA methylase N-4/N-6 domain-containing [Methylocystaceae bacterium]|nr:MAG: DNA methylase N-4/N-6 domain-containing [Methylocystaceae bacterium]
MSVVAFAKNGQTALSKGNTILDTAVDRLEKIEWDFVSAKTNYLTHNLHPYPAKFIPQIPNALIQELSSVGETIGDIFCGSGTTLLEALQLKRHAVGIDANPLAALITRAKTTPLSVAQFGVLDAHLSQCRRLAERINPDEGDFFYNGVPFVSSAWRPDPEMCEFWFLPHVVEELAELRALVNAIPDDAVRTLCAVTLSSIIVVVSKQDSDTRYVRREKSLAPGETLSKYIAQLISAIEAVRELTDLIEARFHCTVYDRNILDTPDTEPFDLVVTSPPYPNAYSYHLYHRTRLLWLGADPELFKRIEIGSHRKYSAKGPRRATEETFKSEFETIFQWLRTRLRDRRHACFVIGDSTLSGERIDNASLIAAAGASAGLREVGRFDRNLCATKKAFNPKIGKIKTERILILRKE